MTTILIPEISDTGHHPSFLRHVLESVDQEDAHILLAGRPNLVSHPELDSVRHRFTPVEVQLSKSEEARLEDFSRIGLVRRQFCVREIYARVWRNLTLSYQIDMVVVPFVDDCVYAFAAVGAPFRQTPWVGVSMRTRFHFPEMGITSDRNSGSIVGGVVFRRVLRSPTLKVLLTNDPTLMHYARARNEKEFSKVQYLPDTCESLVPLDKEEARSSLEIPADCKVILVYGLLSERKGVFNLLQAVAHPDCPTNIHVVLAGSQDASVERFLNSPAVASLISSHRLHLVAGYLPTSVVSQLVYASDAMWVGYIGFYTMSGVLVLASRHGLPSITSEQGIVGYLSRLHRCGIPVDPRSQDSVLTALKRVSRGDPDLDAVAENASRVFSTHSQAEFARVFRAWVRAAGSELST
ncbi:glycosyltransferase [Acidobacteria bacterium AB60]|nr:glycosyltransferase [Acidobacteria bacterium AB60]